MDCFACFLIQPVVAVYLTHKPRGKILHLFLTPWDLIVSLCATWFNMIKCHFLPTQNIYVFCVTLRTNSDFFLVQH
jgi:hypothetical protein